MIRKKPLLRKIFLKDVGGFADQGIVTLSLHRHAQERNRMKKPTEGGDFQFFDLDDYGLSARFETNDPWGGELAYGTDLHRRISPLGGYQFDDKQIRGANLLQGPLAADALQALFLLFE